MFVDLSMTVLSKSTRLLPESGLSWISGFNLMSLLKELNTYIPVSPLQPAKRGKAALNRIESRVSTQECDHTASEVMWIYS